MHCGALQGDSMKYVLILIFFYNGTRSTGSFEIRLIIIVLVFLNYFSPPWFFQRPFANLPSLPQSLPVSPLVHNFSPSSSILHAPRFCRFLALDVLRVFVIVCVSKVCAVGGKYRRGVQFWEVREVLYGGPDSSILL
jgi:hypothetical protein